MSLEAAPALEHLRSARGVVCDVSKLRSSLEMLTEHVGLLQVQSPQEWRRVRRCIAWQGSVPEINQGCVVGVVCIAGTPIGGSWPLALESIKVHQSAGLLRASVETGCYLADSVALAEVILLEEPARILVVDIGPTRFYPE